jgi:hypothetical protein
MSERMLHTKQFGALFKGGGFSTRMDTGQSPTSGYMVSLGGSEKTVPSSMIHPEHLASYAAEHASTLAKPGMHMGGWNDTERSQVDLDTSVNLPSGGPIRRAEAHGAMITHGQRSMYHVDTDTVESNEYYGLTKQAAHAKIKGQYERAAEGHR